MKRITHVAYRMALIAALLAPATPYGQADPTRPWDAADAGTLPAHGAWTLDTVLVSPARRVAIINGMRVSEGETVGNARVTRIHRDGVELRTGDRHIRLHLLPGIVKQHSRTGNHNHEHNR